MITSPETTNLMKAMIGAAPELAAVNKNKQAYGYKYASLDSVIDMLRSVLPKHGLWFLQMPTRSEGRSTLTTRVFHESGEWMEDAIEMTDTELSGKANDTQRVGASITYFRRYALSSIFGIAADEDVDSNLNASKESKRIRQEEPNPSPSKQRSPEEEEEEKQNKATQYLLNNYHGRLKSGEDDQLILLDYAMLIGSSHVRDVKSMPPADVRRAARAIAERDLSNKKLRQNKV